MRKRAIAAVLVVILVSGVFSGTVFAKGVTKDNRPQVSLQEMTTKETSSETKDKTQKPIYKTGVYKVNGVLTYYQNGKVTKKTGVAKRISDGAQVYVENGIFKKATGVAKRLSDGQFVYVKNGIFKKATGVAKRLNGKDPIYVRNGIFKKFTGLAKSLKTGKDVFVIKGHYTNSPKKIRAYRGKIKKSQTKRYVQVYAKALFDSITNSKMSKKEKLKACFYHVADSKKYKNIMKRIPYYHGNDWPIVYAKDMIDDNGSTCFGFSALFGYLAKLCGYKNVYWCSQGYHAWVDIDGRIYDPIFLEVSQYKKLVFNATYSDARAMNIGTTFDNSEYKTKKWMRMKVPKF